MLTCNFPSNISRSIVFDDILKWTLIANKAHFATLVVRKHLRHIKMNRCFSRNLMQPVSVHNSYQLNNFSLKNSSTPMHKWLMRILEVYLHRSFDVKLGKDV